MRIDIRREGILMSAFFVIDMAKEVSCSIVASLLISMLLIIGKSFIFSIAVLILEGLSEEEISWVSLLSMSPRGMISTDRMRIMHKIAAIDFPSPGSIFL